MATRPRGAGPRPAAQRVYEQFYPKSEWKQEGQSDVLLVFLPGFRKENIRLTTEVRNTLRVRGECLVAGNKWIRFQQDFQIPEKCNITGIRAKFEDEILSITMPWKTTTVSQAGTKDGAKTTQLTPTPIPQEANAKPSPQTIKQPIPSQAATSTSDTKKPASQRSRSPPKSVTAPDYTSKIGADKLKDTTILDRPTLQNIADDKISGTKTSSEKVVGQKTSDKSEIREADTYPNDLKKRGKAVGKENIEGIVEKKDIRKPDVEGEKVMEKNIVEGKSGIGGYSVEEYRQRVKRLARGLNEERQLLVNMVVALLVIVALVVYVTYTFGSSGKSANK